MVTYGESPFDLLLTEKVTSPSTELKVTLALDENGNKRIEEFWAPPLPQRQSTGELKWTHQDPVADFVFAQDDWSSGALEPYYSNATHRKYAKSNSVDARGKGVLALGMDDAALSYFLLRNSDAELGPASGVPTGWSAGTGITLTAGTDANRTGNYGLKAIGDGSRNEGDNIASQALDNPKAYRGVEVTFGGYVRMNQGTGSIRIVVADNNSDIAESNSVTSTSWTYISATGTISANATTVTFVLEVGETEESSAGTYHADDLFVFPTGGVTCVGVAVADEPLLQNGEAEDDDVSMWTDSDVSGDTTARGGAGTGASGSDSWVITMDTSSTDDEVYQTVSNHSDYRGKVITFSAAVKVADGSDVIKIFIDDGVDDTQSATSSTTYADLSISHTVSLTSTYLRIGVRLTENGSGGNLASWDEMRAFASPAKSISLYGAFGRVVARYDGTDTWDAVYINATHETEDIVAQSNDIFVSYGSGGYIYGRGTNAETHWVSNTSQHAFHLARSRSKLWISPNSYTIKSAVDPRLGGSFSSAYTIGDARADITNLYAVFDTIFVGKEDGLWKYNRVVNDWAAADEFMNLTDDWEADPNSENFDVGESRHGWLYLALSHQGFTRYDNFNFQDLAYLFNSPRLDDFGGRVRAIAVEPAQVWLLIDTPTSDTTATKTTRLMSLREVSGEIVVHTIQNVDMGLIHRLVVNGSVLHALGSIRNTDLGSDIASLSKWTMPAKSLLPYKDVTPSIATSGTIDLSIWHGDMPNTPKALVAVDIWHKNNLDGQHTIAVKFGKDGDVPSTKTVGTLNASGQVSTVYTHSLSDPIADAVGRFFQFQLALTTDDTVSPEVYAIVAHFSLKLDRLRVWEIFIDVDASTPAEGRADWLASLTTLQNQTYPINIQMDVDGDGTTENVAVQVVDRRIVYDDSPVGGNKTIERKGLVHLIVQEVRTTSTPA